MRGSLLIPLIFLALCYFLPTVIAIVRKRVNIAAIAALNLLLGWTVIGWVVALVWALARDAAPTIVHVHQDGRPADRNY